MPEPWLSADDISCHLGVTKDTVYESIFKINGDTLTLAIHIGATKQRPTKFESVKDSGVVVVTLKREKQ